MVIHIRRHWLRYILLGTIAVFGIAFAMQYLRPTIAIYDYQYSRDADLIRDIFKRDIYWLSTDPNYSPEYMLHNKQLQNTQYIGDFYFKVAYQQQKFAGIVAYYRKNALTGFILFIDVQPQFRSQQIGYKLLDYAMRNLIKLGSKKIEIITRTNNIPAQKLYTRYGFKENARAHGLVYYEYVV